MPVAAAKMTLNGDRSLRTLMEELPKRLVKKGLRQSMNAAIEPMRKDARSRAKEHPESGLLGKSIAKKIKTYAAGNVAAILGANRAVEGIYKGRRRVPANYIALVEGGTQPHHLGKGASIRRRKAGEPGGGQHPGTPARPFLEDAYHAHAAEAVGIAGDKLASSLEAEAAKLANVK